MTFSTQTNNGDSLPIATAGATALTQAQVASSLATGAYPSQWLHGAALGAKIDPLMLNQINQIYNMEYSWWRI
jgi:hypothetical protein